MQPEDRDAAYLWDMLEAAREVADMLKGQDPAAFLADRILLRATERGVELIGEAAHPDIPWRKIIGQHNILAHEYGQIDHALLYKTAVDDIAMLIAQIRALLPPLEEDEPWPHRPQCVQLPPAWQTATCFNGAEPLVRPAFGLDATCIGWPRYDPRNRRGNERNRVHGVPRAHQRARSGRCHRSCRIRS